MAAGQIVATAPAERDDERVMNKERWLLIERTYHSALEREGDARSAFLDEACARDEELRSEVEELIGHDGQASRFIESPALEVAAKQLAQDQVSSMVGRQLGSYKILSQLGAGGMGEVYLAEDTRLSRKVAIKFILARSAADEQAQKRLIREAQAAARLDHPNICAIHEVGHQDNVGFIVMQYVEGETLASRIQRNPLQLGDALDISIQVAGALSAAHSQGIIHRDIKPQNIIINSRGQLKVLDFGLAKVIRHEELFNSKAETEALLSVPGVIMGTPAYMSPEQVRGETLDARTDIFSFGSVLYEMVSGRHPFGEASPAATLSAILTREPAPLARYASDVPDELQRIVRKALSKGREARYQGIEDLLIDLRELKQDLEFEAKLERSIGSGGRDEATQAERIESREPAEKQTEALDPVRTDPAVRKRLAKDSDERWQSAHDLTSELTEIAETGSQASILLAVGSERKKRERVAWIAVTVVLLSTSVIMTVAYLRRAPTEGRTVRSFILPPEKSSFNFIDEHSGSVTVSPDGRRVTFVAPTAEGKNLLWVRSLDALSAQALTGTEDASFPFWSPDSRLLGFFADEKLKKIEAGGGPTLTLCNAPLARGGTWNRDGVIIFAPDAAGPLQQVSASGGASGAVTQLDEARGEMTHRWPYFLPDGQHFLYLSRGASASESDTRAIHVASLKSKESKLLLRASSNVAYAQGYLLFLREGTLMAQAFDDRSLEMTGGAFPIAEQVQSEPSMARGAFAVSENGVLAYQTGSVRNGSELAWFDRNGKRLSVLGDLAIYDIPQLSPNGKRLTVAIVDPQNGNQDLWLYELARGLRTRLTVDPADERSPAWSPDGSRIVFSSNRKGHVDLYQKATSGVGSEELLLESNLDKFATSWSPDGKSLLYDAVDPKSRRDLWVLPMTGDRKPFPFLQTEFTEANGQFSPDGRWIAYSSDESGRSEIYVMPFPGTGGKWQISTSGGSHPKWRGDGREIFYLAPDNKLMAAEVNGQGPALEAGAVRPLFEVRPYLEVGGVYDLTSDGQRFLINTTVEQKVSAPITLVLNWTADLKH